MMCPNQLTWDKKVSESAFFERSFAEGINLGFWPRIGLSPHQFSLDKMVWDSVADLSAPPLLLVAARVLVEFTGTIEHIVNSH